MFLFENKDAAAPPKIWSVTQLNTRAKQLLEHNLGQVQVAGEITNYRHDRSGHRYFSLKDPGGVLPAAFFKQRAGSLHFEPRDGMQVVAHGSVTVYGPSGRYQLMVSRLLPQGEGALQAAFNALKQRLEAEGLFAAAKKRPLPLLPRRIAVITSPSGAVWRDIQEVGSRRFPGVPLLLVPARVQGSDCVPDLLAAIDSVGQYAQALAIDVLILARGGGSLEDLWGFNDEAVARRIAACPIPVVSAVGHETDFTIADFIADVRAPTPSAAAELVVPLRSALAQRLSVPHSRLVQALARHLRHERVRLRALAAKLGDGRRSLWPHTQRLAQADSRLVRGMRQRLARHMATWAAIERRLAGLHPRLLLARQRAAQARAQAQMQNAAKARLSQLRQRLRHSTLQPAVARHSIHAARARLDHAIARIQALSPLAVLQRGYSIVATDQGQVVRAAHEVPQGSHLRVRLADGELGVQVVAVGLPSRTDKP